MSFVVCDASVIFKLIVAESDSPKAFALAENHQIAVPEFFFLEIGNALWSRVRTGKSLASDVPELLDDIDAFGFDVRPLKPLLRPAMALAISIGHPIYDCVYFALAASLEVTLVTADQRFLSAVRKSNVGSVEVKSLAEFV